MDSKVKYHLAGMALFLVVLLFPNSTSAEQYIVGDQAGWSRDVDYFDWTNGKNFHVGDVLVFKYAKGEHNVIEVDGNDFNYCTTSSELRAYNSGHDVITLTEPGLKYFICTYNCEFFNQKIAIDVI